MCIERNGGEERKKDVEANDAYYKMQVVTLKYMQDLHFTRNKSSYKNNNIFFFLHLYSCFYQVSNYYPTYTLAIASNK